MKIAPTPVPNFDRMNFVHAAGHRVRLEARHHLGRAGRSAVCPLGLIGVGLLVDRVAGPESTALFLAIGCLVSWDAWRHRKLGVRYRSGAVAEERFDSRLWKLEELGWLVEHDVPKRGGGDVDHVVQSPAITFVVETKAGRGRPEDLDQARRHAEWASRRFGSSRTVIPVLCLQGSRLRPKSVDGVCRVGAAHLVDFMLDRG
jgi:hypothetical protein